MKNRFAGLGLLGVACACLVILTPRSGHAHPPQRGERIKCESIDGLRRFCEADIRGEVRITRQISDKECIRGRNWGWNAQGIWVDGGCRAEFEFESRGFGFGQGGRYGSGNLQQIRCESIDGRRNFCAADIRGQVRITRQISDRPCAQGRNWGWNAQGIWVDNGCRADFEYVEGGGRGRGERGRGGWGGDDRGRGSYILTCESDNNRYRECRLDRPSDVRLGRQLSDARCERNRSWGLSSSQRAIWVNHGCRGEFEVTPR